MRSDNRIGLNLVSSLLSCLQEGVTLCWVPSLRAAAPWQLWDLSTELEQGQAGRQHARQDYRPATLQRRTTATGLTCSRLWWVYRGSYSENRWFVFPVCVCYLWRYLDAFVNHPTPVYSVVYWFTHLKTSKYTYHQTLPCKMLVSTSEVEAHITW